MAGKLARLAGEELPSQLLGLSEGKDTQSIACARIVSRAERLIVLAAIAITKPGNP